MAAGARLLRDPAADAARTPDQRNP